MSDLISRQDAIEAVEESRRLNHHQDGKVACAHEYEHRHFLKILRDLPSAQPEQADCEYCHEDADGYVRPIEKNSHAWLVRRGRTMKLRVRFNGGYSECDILFCPMCGRRLIDG